METQTVAEATPAVSPAVSVTEEIHSQTLTGPVATNAAMLDNRAPETATVYEAKKSVILKIQGALADVRGLVLERAKRQAVVIGYVAELLGLKPTNKELASALTEKYRSDSSELSDGTS